MKTTCYCVGCPKHPLFKDRGKYKFYTGFEVGRPIWKEEFLVQGKDVDCLDPVSDAFSDLGVDPKDHDFLVTAYGDGQSLTGLIGSGYEIIATCDNEEYVE